MAQKMSVSITSPPDREKLVAEINVGNEQWAELNQEDGTLKLEFYPRPNGEFWQLSFDEVLEALDNAKKRLVGE
jgi:hypothetical protein